MNATMKNVFYTSSLLLVLAWSLYTATLQAQCDFTPTVVGDLLLCPGAGGQLSTQSYDSYQWQKRTWPNGTWADIPNATNQTLSIGPDDVLFNFRVRATVGSCTENSTEVLVDGRVFLLPVVEHGGVYTFSPQGGYRVCTGDSMTLRLLLPYTTNITWFRNDQPMADTTNLLVIREAGAYTVQGAPGVCPDFIVPLGITFDVEVVDCSPSSVYDGEKQVAGLRLSPQPAYEQLTVSLENDASFTALELFDLSGQRRLSTYSLSPQTRMYLSLEGLPAGIYLLRIFTDGYWLSGKLVKL
jgi:hypothetical protein